MVLHLVFSGESERHFAYYCQCLSQAQYSDGADLGTGSWELYWHEISPLRFAVVEMTMGDGW